MRRFYIIMDNRGEAPLKTFCASIQAVVWKICADRRVEIYDFEFKKSQSLQKNGLKFNPL